MVKELTYTTINHVIESWESLKRTKNYEEVAGSKMFQRLFDECPQAKIVFGFPIDIDVYSSELLRSKRFLAHAAYLLDMIGTALDMLGPDIELLTLVMLDLGKKHIRFGVKPEMFPIMGEALIYMLEDTLGDEFTEEMTDAWITTYSALSGDMIRGMMKGKKKSTKCKYSQCSRKPGDDGLTRLSRDC
jgi:hemoglobin-like flavoprotein